VNVDVVIDAEFIATLKVAVTVELTATAVAALPGVVAVTVGGTGGGGGGVLDPPPHPARTNEIARQRTLTRITTLFRSFGWQALPYWEPKSAGEIYAVDRRLRPEFVSFFMQGCLIPRAQGAHLIRRRSNSKSI